MPISRRSFLLGGTAVAAVAAGALWMRQVPTASHAAEGTFEVTKTEAEWREVLDEFEYAVLREEATERPWTSPLLDEHRAGTFVCRGCDLPLFDAATKYDSGTGWPSFWQPVSDDLIGTTVDYIQGYATVEAHCATCGGHLGHIFGDGPAPTYKRHCINGDALVFKPGEVGQG